MAGLTPPSEEERLRNGFSQDELDAIAKYRPPLDDSQWDPICTCWKCQKKPRPK